MTKTAMNDLRPCWRCEGITLWRSRDGVVHCAQCSQPHAHYLIAQRLRAVPAPPSQLRRAMRFILLQLKGAWSVDAKSVIDAAGREKISVATLTRARTLLRIRSQKQRSGWMWVRPPQ